MTTTLSLLCYVLGDPSQSIFEVKITAEETVGDLKKAIKEKKKRAFDDIDAKSLVLWRVSVPCSQSIKHDVEELNFADKKSLQPYEILSDVFPDPLEKRTVHIAITRPVVTGESNLNLPSLLRIFCYVRGDAFNDIFEVKITAEETVGDLKKVIKDKKKRAFDDIDAGSLVLWKVSIRCSESIKHDVEKLNFADEDSLRPYDILSDVFPDPLEKRTVHIMVTRPIPSIELDMHPAEQGHWKVIQDTRDALAPSTVSSPPNSHFISEQNKHPIYNGRPANLTGPPLSIYHPAFAKIGDALQNLDRLVDRQEEQRVGDTAKLCQAAANIYHTERERLEAVYPLVETLLGIQMTRNVNTTTEIDGLVQQAIKDSDKKGVAVHVELKNELGLSGLSTLQNTLSLRKHLIQPQYDEIRNTTCCPCITVSVAGPYISFGGAIFADIFVAEQFTDFIYLGGTSKKILTLSRIFAAVARGIEILKGYYHSLELRPLGQLNLARLFPCPTYFPGKHPTSSTLVFSGRFDYNGREAGNYRRSIFEATYNNATMLVKFCESYHGEAHHTLADAELAPNLFFCEKLRGGVTMIIMELVDGEDAFHHFMGKDLPNDILEQVKSAVGMLHDRNLVFGDLRRPNIMIKERENKELRALLIDFDWVGTADQARYPSSLNNSGEIAWANGVRPHGLMRKSHDLGMIDLLNSSVELEEVLTSST
ncbi:hypothetical protein H0H81_009377 [Sphagnurus paluster]|uniref:Protein kinase domain-containing protein n=1 Tax=Sphagnurus paluster TaxID=117069 RepID=A0A9P7GMI1_9AGAR|nr:hypothetical protein H0H81_009377 [Sphagnurus paluster]